MLEIVSKGFKNARNILTGHVTLNEANIDEAMREIRVSLLEADVELGVVKTFLARVKDRAVGEVVKLSVEQGKKKLQRSPGEHFILICQNELENLMGPTEEAPIAFRRPYTTIMMVGLQGVGKTTTVGKLAKYLKAQKRKPLLVAADIYRPAAVEQLKVLGERIGVPVFAKEGLAPPQLCADALREAKKRKRDVVIFDTAGRLAVDDELMRELEEIKSLTKPHETFLVCDAMAGQDTVRTASEFNRRLDLSGFIMTKLDGDARGGAALSIKEITGKPIKFLGMGEGLDKLETFRPEGLASRILGMGDIVGLMKDFEAVVDEKEAERDTKKLLRGQFTLDDFLKQIKLLQNMGNAKDLFDKFLGDQIPEGAEVDDSAFKVMESLIHSMTPVERTQPTIIDKSRAARIAKGSGRKPEQVMDLVQRFAMMQQMMAGIAQQPGLMANLPGFKQLNQMRQMKGGAKGDAFGRPEDMMKQLGIKPGSLPPGGFPPGMMPDGMMQPGMTPPTMEGMQAPSPQVKLRTPKQKKNAKDKRKAQRKARKKRR